MLNQNRRPGTAATSAESLKPDRWAEVAKARPGRFRGKELGEMFKLWSMTNATNVVKATTNAATGQQPETQ